MLQVPVIAHDAKAGTITYEDPDTKEPVTTPVTGGRCKLQWKPDWAMRWVALGVDYEMAGKDLIDSVKLSGEICRALGGTPPEGFNYELFLDENGQKISKSKGNGLTIEEWLRYAAPESLSLFMYREPKAAKRLYFDVIPRTVDEYQQFLDGYERQDAQAAAVQSGLAHPFRQSAEGRHAGHVLDAADAGVVVERGERRDAVGLHRPLPAGRDAADASEARMRWSTTPSTISATSCCRRRNSASRATTERAALIDLRDALSQLPADATRRRHPGRRLRDRPARAVPRPEEEGEGRQAGRLARLVQHALPGAARPGERPALRLVRRGLWICRTPST